MTSHLMKAGNDIRHTLFGAFSPTQNVTSKLRGSLERVTYANLFPALLNFLHVFFTFCGLQLLPDNIHELANGKLHISVTDVYTGKNILIKNYRDKQEVIDAVVTSCFMYEFITCFHESLFYDFHEMFLVFWRL